MNIKNSLMGTPRRKRMKIIQAVIFAVVGLGLMAGGGSLVRTELSQSNWPTATGTVRDVRESRDSEGQIMYSPVIAYSANGKAYTLRNGSSSSIKPTIGSETAVRYNPANPSEAKTGNLGFVIGSVLVVAGLIAAAIGIGGYVWDRKRSSTVSNLKQIGQKVQGVVTYVEPSYNTSSSSIVVTAIDPTTSQPREYKSDAISGSTLGFADYQTRSIVVDVYIDPSDASKYYVDVDQLPSVSVESIRSLLGTLTPSQSIPPVPPQPNLQGANAQNNGSFVETTATARPPMSQEAESSFMDSKHK